MLSIVFFNLGNNHLFAQLNAEQQELINQYTKQINDFKIKNQLKNAAHYSNKCAAIYLGAGIYQVAINFYLESSQLNDQIGNDIDNKKIYNNMAMLYSEMNQLKNSIKYFEKSLLISRRYNNKSEIAVSLMDISTILSLNKEHNKSIEYLEEALKISNDLEDLQNLRTCYNLLSQSHKAAGNDEKSAVYFNYYMAYDKKIREGKEIPDYIKKNFLSSESLNLQEDIEDKDENISQLNSPDLLNSSNETSNSAYQVSKEKATELQIEILNKDNELTQFKLKTTIEDNKNYKLLIYIGVSILIVLAIVLTFGIIYLRKKQLYIKVLEERLGKIEKVSKP